MSLSYLLLVSQVMAVNTANMGVDIGRLCADAWKYGESVTRETLTKLEQALFHPRRNAMDEYVDENLTELLQPLSLTHMEELLMSQEPLCENPTIFSILDRVETAVAKMDANQRSVICQRLIQYMSGKVSMNNMIGYLWRHNNYALSDSVLTEYANYVRDVNLPGLVHVKDALNALSIGEKKLSNFFKSSWLSATLRQTKNWATTALSKFLRQKDQPVPTDDNHGKLDRDAEVLEYFKDFKTNHGKLLGFVYDYGPHLRNLKAGNITAHTQRLKSHPQTSTYNSYVSVVEKLIEICLRVEAHRANALLDSELTEAANFKL